MKNEHSADTVYHNATVVDGSGGARFSADVAVSDGKISAIGELQQIKANRRVDARGRILSPGFIDAHTHDDLELLKRPAMLPKVSQGVTTVITGNCGISLAPMTSRRLVPPFDLLGESKDFAYPRLKDYIERLQTNGAALNSAMLVGHSTLRLQAMDDLQRPANRKERQQMSQQLMAALAEGAIGMSTGLAYPPANAAPTDEVVELAATLSDYGAIYTTHMRDEENRLLESVEETLEIGKRAAVPVVISHHKACGKRNWGRTKESLRLIEQARRNQQVDLDVYPYTASSTVLLPAFVERSERVTITWSKAMPECGGRDLDMLASSWGIDRAAAVERLQPAGAIYHQMSEDDLQRVLRYTPSMIGSDGIPGDQRPHPRLWGTFPRVLGHFCRELNLFSLEQAVYKMSGKTASVFGLQERGTITVGNWADLVLFDHEVIIDNADYDHPERPASGIVEVMVNGEIVYDELGVKDARPGRYLGRR